MEFLVSSSPDFEGRSTTASSNNNDNTDNTGFIVGYAILAVVSFTLMILSIVQTTNSHRCRHRKDNSFYYSHYYGTTTIRFLFPLANLCMVVENATLAATVGEVVLTTTTTTTTAWNNVVHVLQATVAPCLLLSTFDITFILHRVRHLSFCGIGRCDYRASSSGGSDSHSGTASSSTEQQTLPPQSNNHKKRHHHGRRSSSSPMQRIRQKHRRNKNRRNNNNNDSTYTVVLVWSIRLLAVLLLVLALLVNFNVGFDPPSPLVGTVGWYTVIVVGLQPFTQPQQVLQVTLGLVPMSVVALLCFYLSLILWNYGTHYSMVVHSSICNLWMTSVVGTVALAIGQWLGNVRWFPLGSNMSICIFATSLVILLTQVNKDLHEATQLNVFLGAFDDWKHAEEEEHQHKRVEQESSLEQQQYDDVVLMMSRSEEVLRNGTVVIVDEEVKTQDGDNGNVVQVVEKDQTTILKEGKLVEQHEEEKVEIGPPP